MGEVWEAVDTRLGRRVAVKVLRPSLTDDPEFVERFRVEARTVACSTTRASPACTTTAKTEMDGEGRTAYLVMELVNGEPLTPCSCARGRLVAAARPCDMLEQTGRALQVAHERGPGAPRRQAGQHPDHPDGQVKLTDFGIAKAVDAAPVTQTGMVMGTAQYIAPEQAAGRRGDRRRATSTRWESLATSALAGQAAVPGDGAADGGDEARRSQPPPLPADLPPNVRELIEITLVKNPAHALPHRRRRSPTPSRPSGAASRCPRRVAQRPVHARRGRAGAHPGRHRRSCTPPAPCRDPFVAARAATVAPGRPPPLPLAAAPSHLLAAVSAPCCAAAGEPRCELAIVHPAGAASLLLRPVRAAHRRRRRRRRLRRPQPAAPGPVPQGMAPGTVDGRAVACFERHREVSGDASAARAVRAPLNPRKRLR